MTNKTYTGVFSSDVYGHYDEISSKTPDFHEKRARGDFLPVNYYRFYRRDHVQPTVLTYNGYRNEHAARGVVTFAPAYSSGVYQAPPPQQANYKIESGGRMHQICSNKLVERARNVEIDLGVALGEFGETSRFIASTLRKSVEMMTKLKKGDISGALRTYRQPSHRNLRGTGTVPYKDRADVRAVLDAAADTQLTTSFALTPLINDVNDAIHILNHGLENPKLRIQTVRASHEASGEFDHFLDIPNPMGTYASKFRYSSRCSGKIMYVADDPRFATLESIGLINPLSVAWELVPLSFVLDWFIPVGGYIENVFAPQGLKFIAGYTYCKAKSSTHQRTSLVGWNTECNGTEMIKERIPLTSFPPYKLIVPDLSLNKRQVKDGLSLLWNFFS